MDLQPLSQRQSQLVGAQRSAVEVVRGLYQRYHEGASHSSLNAEVTHVAWASVHFSCIVSKHEAEKIMALGMLTQEQGTLAQAITDLGIIVFGIALPKVVERICAQNKLDPPWTVKVRPEVHGVLFPSSIDRTLSPTVAEL